MQKILFFSGLALMALLIVSCKTQSPATGGKTPDAHNSMNSLDWAGVYSGMLPCADCEGIQTLVRLNLGNTYTVETSYKGKPGKPVREEGTFRWNEAGNIISLTPSKPGGEPSMYAVGENKLTRLGKDGKPVTGELAPYYVLVKDASGLAGRYWKLTEVFGKPVAANPDLDREVYMTLDPTDQRVFGSGGCNSFFGKYEIKEQNQLSFSQMGSTKMACPGMSTEDLFFDALNKAGRYRLVQDTLWLENSSAGVLAKFIDTGKTNP